MSNSSFFTEAVKRNPKIGWREIFSESFVRHSKADREQAMQTGTIARQVPESRMLSTWHKPWLWWQAAKAALALTALIYAAVFLSYTMMGMTVVPMKDMLTVLPPLLFPLVIMIFFWEMNIPQNVSMGDTIAFYLVSAVISFGVTGVAFLFVSGDAAKYAALREEPAKLVACLAIFWYLQTVQKKKIYGMTGLLVGAVVGAAFSGIESVSYALEAGRGVESIVRNQLARGLFSIAGHIAYAVPYSCAIALHADRGRVRAGSVVCVETLVALCLSVALHWLWNSCEDYLAVFALCCVAPFRYIYWIRKGLNQIAAICAAQNVEAPGRITLCCQTTALSGRSWPCGGEPLTIGRQVGVCGLCFPADTQGVSRVHCRVFRTEKGWAVQDLNSSNGTYVDGRRLAPQETALIHSGSELCIGSPRVRIIVK